MAMVEQVDDLEWEVIRTVYRAVYARLPDVRTDYFGDILKLGDTVRMEDGKNLCIDHDIRLTSFNPLATGRAIAEVILEHAPFSKFAARCVEVSYDTEAFRCEAVVIYGTA